ncbi:hypothetical protein BJY00DRAFT_313939 [Aspergillus carlsbadensis]|nr:hypothetical protein BJY00DRAFT_313939 [Aspergillus carlsbadensis]
MRSTLLTTADKRALPARARSGRGAPRSRAGCITCKRRHVRCDEARPVCGHCARLSLECVYKSRPPDQHQQNSALREQARPLPPRERGRLVGQAAQQEHCERQVPGGNKTMYVTGSVKSTNADYGLNMDWWTDPSWPGQFVSLQSPSSWGSVRDVILDVDELAMNPPTSSEIALPPGLQAGPEQVEMHAATIGISTDQDLLLPPQGPSPCRSTALGGPEMSPRESSHHAKLLGIFQDILQPPAAILIGGQRRWRRLRRYLMGLSTSNRAVRHALLCVIELLGVEQISTWNDQSRAHCEARIMDNHGLACEEIDTMVHGAVVDMHAGLLDELLAAIVLLAWFEVIQDQDGHTLRFPQQCAEIIITADYRWNRYSRHLLSWMSTLDSKATCLSGGCLLLSPRSLDLVSKYPAPTPTIWGALDHPGIASSDSICRSFLARSSSLTPQKAHRRSLSRQRVTPEPTRW